MERCSRSQRHRRSKKTFRSKALFGALAGAAFFRKPACRNAQGVYRNRSMKSGGIGMGKMSGIKNLLVIVFLPG